MSYMITHTLYTFPRRHTSKLVYLAVRLYTPGLKSLTVLAVTPQRLHLFHLPFIGHAIFVAIGDGRVGVKGGEVQTHIVAHLVDDSTGAILHVVMTRSSTASRFSEASA